MSNSAKESGGWSGPRGLLPSGLRQGRRDRRGFTLIELLLALALLTLLMTSLLTFVFSMGAIWGRGGEKRLFEQHVNAVSRHVESLLRRATWPRGGPGPTEPFAVREVRPANGPLENLLGFELLEGDRLMEWPEVPLPEVRCHLALVRERGLVLYWRSLLEEEADEKPPRVALVSPLVTGLAYAYQDPNSGTWRTETLFRKNNTQEWLLPDRLVLTFKQGTFEAVRELTLPHGGNPPLF